MLGDSRFYSLLMLEFGAHFLCPELENLWLLPSAWGLWGFGYAIMRSSDVLPIMRYAALWGLLSAAMNTGISPLVSISWVIAVFLSHLASTSLRMPSLLLFAVITFALSFSLKCVYWGLWGLIGGVSLRTWSIELLFQHLVTSSSIRALYDVLGGMGAYSLSALLTLGTFRSSQWRTIR